MTDRDQHRSAKERGSGSLRATASFADFHVRNENV